MATPIRLVPLRVLVGGTLFVHGFARLFGGPNRKVPEAALKYLGDEYQEWMEGASIYRVYWGHGMVGGGGWELPMMLMIGALTVVLREEDARKTESG